MLAPIADCASGRLYDSRVRPGFGVFDFRFPRMSRAAPFAVALDGVGLAPERRAFHPHITLARFGRRSAAFAVDCFTLFESHLSRHGAHYEEVASYPLA